MYKELLIETLEDQLRLLLRYSSDNPFDNLEGGYIYEIIKEVYGTNIHEYSNCIKDIQALT